MNRFIGEEVDRAYHRARADRPSKSVISLALDAYLKGQAGGSTSRSLQDFKRLIAPQLRVFLFAGRDTTSNTFLYSFYLLSKSPGALERVRAEHDEVFGGDPRQAHSRICEDAQLLNRLPCTLAVIKETLRLFPPSASMRAGRPDAEVVDDDGNRYPTAGCNVWTLSVAVHHNGGHWRDVESFIPERWLVGPGDPLYPARGAWRAFEFGPRSCIGQTLALLELRVAMVMTLREFDIAPAYEDWDCIHPRTAVKAFNGHRAYQAEKGGGGAHPADEFPRRVTLRM